MMTRKNKDKLANLVKENLDLIKNNKYEWKNEEIELFYEYANEVCNYLKIKENREDIIQDMLVKVFSGALAKLDLDKYEDPLNYLFVSMKNIYIKNQIYNSRKKRNEDGIYTLSLDKLDQQASSILTPEEAYVKEELNKYIEKIEKIIIDDPLLNEYLVKQTQLSSMAKKYNMPISTLALDIYDRLDRIKIMSTEDGFYDYIIPHHNNPESREIRNQIEKLGVLGANVVKGITYKDIAKAINVKERIIQKKVNDEKRKIREILKDNKIKVSSLGVDLYIYVFEDYIKDFSNISNMHLKYLEAEIFQRRLDMFYRSINVSETLDKKEIGKLKLEIEEIKKDINKRMKKEKYTVVSKKR